MSGPRYQDAAPVTFLSEASVAELDRNLPKPAASEKKAAHQPLQVTMVHRTCTWM